MDVKYDEDQIAFSDMAHRLVWKNGHGLTIYVLFFIVKSL
jgi:hypothetical protein